MSGYNDPDKLRDALELARSFGLAKDKKPSEKGKGSAPSSSRSQRSQNFQPPGPFHPRPPRDSLSPTAPPPSKRNPNASSSFFTPGVRNTGNLPVIGSSGFDFLRRQDAKQPSANTAIQDNKAARPVAKTDVSIKQIPGPQVTKTNPDTNAPQVDREPTPNEGPLPDNKTAGNILDTFYALVAQKPTIGQQIDEIADRLPNAMDLNGPGKQTPPVLSKTLKPGSQFVICTCMDFGMSNKDSSSSEPCPIHGNTKITLNLFATNHKENTPPSNTQRMGPQVGNSASNLTTGSCEKPDSSHAVSIPRSSVQPHVNTKENMPLSGSTPSEAPAGKQKGLSASMWAS